MKNSLFAFWSTLLLFAYSCGDDEISKNDISEKVANATLMMDFTGESNFADTDLTLKKARVWKSRGNGEAGGLYNAIDVYAVELWYTFSTEGSASEESSEEEPTELRLNEETSQDSERYAIISGLRSTEDGFLYHPDSPPGTVIEAIPTGLSRLNSDGLFSFSRDKKLGLVGRKYPAHFIYNETTGKTGETITKKQVVKANEIENSGWENVFQYQLFGKFDENSRFEKNEDFKTKGNLGCLVKKADGSGTLAAKSFLFGEIELGGIIKDSKDQEGSASVSDEKTLGDDDELWIEWQSEWYLAGLNWQQRTLSLIKSTQAPFYTNRSLPGVDSGDSKAKSSGINSLVKKCNDAASNTGGSFQFIGLSSSFTAPTISDFGGSNQYCQVLADENEIDKGANNNVDYGCPGLFNLNFLRAGTFDGSSHSGPVSSVDSTINYRNMTAPVQNTL